MRRLILAGCIALMSASAAGSAAEQAFDQGMQALEKKDWEQALGHLERALTADPDNVRYASEYRQAVLRHAQTLHPKDGQVADFERSLKFFERLTAQSPTASNAFL